MIKLTIEKLDFGIPNPRTELYEVHVNNHCIDTIYISSSSIAAACNGIALQQRCEKDMVVGFASYHEGNREIIQLCFGSVCHVYELEDDSSFLLLYFFMHPRVKIFSTQMSEVLKKLLDDHMIEFNRVGAGDACFNEEAQLCEEGYMGGYSDKGPKLSMEKVMHATYDAYHSFLVGEIVIKYKKPKKQSNKILRFIKSLF